MDSYSARWLKAQFPGEDLKKLSRLDLMAMVIAKNHEKVAKTIDGMSAEYYRGQLRKMEKSTASQIKLPDLAKTAQAVQLRKAKDRGQLISSGLRAQLSDDLRAAVAEHLETQGSRGKARGRMNPDLVDRFEQALTKTFKGYCVSKGGELPPNIRTIAETEIRSTVSDVKHSYVSRLIEENPGRLKVRKRWLHFPSRAPRLGHKAMNGRTVAFEGFFMVPSAAGGKIAMKHPHDPTAPIGETANCHCECDYLTEILPGK